MQGLSYVLVHDTFAACVKTGFMVMYSILQAKGLVSEYQPKYNSARAVYRERKKYADEIDWNMLPVPPSGTSKVASHSFFSSL